MSRSGLITVLLLSVFIGCKDKENTETGTEFPEEFQKVWQDEAFDDGDEIGLYMTSDAIWTWDYYGDDFDQGEDCYDKLKVVELVSFKGNEFTISSVFDDEEFTLTMEIDGNELTISGEEDGEEFSSLFSRDSRNISELTPSCSDQSGKIKDKPSKFLKTK